MTHIIIKGNVKDPNAELERAGYSQDLKFGGQNTLLKKDKLSYLDDTAPKLRYWKVIVDFQPIYGYCLEGQPAPNGLHVEWVSREEALKHIIDQVEGEGSYDRGLNKYRMAKRYLKIKELELIRNTISIESKLLK